MTRIPTRSPQPWTPPTERLIGERVLQEKELRGQITQTDQASQQRDERLSTRISELEEEWRKLADWRGAADQSISGLIGKVRVGGGGRRTIAKVLERDYGITGPISGGSGSSSDYDTLTDAAAATIPAEVSYVRTAGYATVGDYGGALYVREASEPSLPGKFQSADGAWWKIKEIVVTPQMFGAKGDWPTTNDYQAIRDAIDHVSVAPSWGDYPTGPTVFFPPAAYRIDSTIELKKCVKLCGGGSGMLGDASPQLYFAVDTTGFVINRYDTANGGVESPDSTGADGTIIEGLLIKGSASSTPGAAVHGIWMRARAVIRDCHIAQFPGNGINIVATEGAATTLRGNANNWHVSRVTIQYAGLTGLKVDGSDANAGVAIEVNARYCGRYGIWDSSFLGNTFIACHTANNGMTISGYNTADQSAAVDYAGQIYYANPTSTEADYVATTPGTDETVWKAGAVSGGHVNRANWTAAMPEGTYFAGGAYRADNPNASPVFLGCYAEGGQAASDFTADCLCIGGTMRANPFTNGGGISGLQGNILQAEGSGAKLAVDYLANDGDQWLGGGSGAIFGWDGSYRFDRYGDTDVGFNYLNASSNTSLIITGDSTLRTFGTGAVVKHTLQLPKVALGSGSDDARLITYAAAAPTSGAHANGEITFDRATALGGSVGWTCTTAGTPGTWTRFGAVEAQQTIATNAAFTLTPETSPRETLHTGVLTADRAVTLSTTGAWAGLTFRITRTGVDAFNLNVGTGPLKALATNTWGVFVFDGSAWYLAAYGAL